MARPEVPWLGSGFRFDKPPLVRLADAAAAFYDLNLLYELVALVSLPQYANYPIDRRFWYRNGRGVRPPDQAYLYRAEFASPLLLEIAFSPIAIFGPWLIRRWIAAADDVINFIDGVHDRPARREEERQERVVRAKERRKRELDLDREIAEREHVAALNARIDDGLRKLDHAALEDLLDALVARGALSTYENVRKRISDNPVRPRELDIFPAYDAGEEDDEVED
jgi:hypothetical protein